MSTPAAVPHVVPSALPDPPNDRSPAGGVSTTTAVTDLLETLGVLAFATAVPAWAVGWWLTGLLVIAGVAFFVWAIARRTRRAGENERDLYIRSYRFTGGQLANIAKGLPPDAASALSVIRPNEPVTRWQLLSLLGAEMGEARAMEVLPAVLRYASK